MIERYEENGWNLIAANKEDMEALDIEILKERQAYYDTPEKRLNLLAQLQQEVYYAQHGTTNIPRLDRTIINFK